MADRKTPENTNRSSRLSPKHKGGEARFSQAAIDYIDALLELQNAAFQKERDQIALKYTTTNTIAQNPFQKLPLPNSLQLFAEEDSFTGGGWSQLSGNHKNYRWMRRIAGLLIRTDLKNGGTITINGANRTRRRFVRQMSVWLDGVEIKGKVRISLCQGWTFSGTLPCVELPLSGHHLLTIKSPGIKRCKTASPFEHASLAVHTVSIKGL